MNCGLDPRRARGTQKHFAAAAAVVAAPGLGSCDRASEWLSRMPRGWGKWEEER